MGSGTDPGQRTQLRRLKLGIRAVVISYVALYAILYKNVHLRREKVTGNVYLDMWPEKEAKDISNFAFLPYCQESCRRADAVAQQQCEDRTKPCGFVNEVDLFSFADDFIPTFVQVARQRASCIDGTQMSEGCQLDYGTNAAALEQVDSYYIGAIDSYKVQLTHAFRYDGASHETMADAVPVDMPFCGAEAPLKGMCRDPSGGGHDLATVAGLLAAGGLSLDANNDATNHPNGREGFRTSGLKVHLRVRYKNIAPWWSFLGPGKIGYSYEIEAIPAQSVYRERTARTEAEKRVWAHPSKLTSMQMYDRLLVWADGVDIKTEVVGEVGRLDLTELVWQLLVAAPLLYFARNIAELCIALWSNRSKYDSAGQADDGDAASLEELQQVMSESAQEPGEGEVAPL